MKDNNIALLTQAILFLGSPHEGSPMSIVGALIACTGYWRDATTQFHEFLHHGNPDLLQIDKEFQYAFTRKSLERKPYIVDFREGKPEEQFGLYVGAVRP